MKLHLPVKLFQTLTTIILGVPSTLPATEALIPGGFTEIEVDELSDISSCSSSSANHAFIIDCNLLPDGTLSTEGISTPLMTSTSGAWYLTSQSESSKASFSVNKSTTQLFDIAENGALIWENLATLAYTQTTSHKNGTVVHGGTNSHIAWSGNDTIIFSGNSTNAAIYGEQGCAIALNDNKKIIFSNNQASTQGAAIYSHYGDIDIRNNDSVEFSGNVNIFGGTYKLQSISAFGSSENIISFSAPEEKSIIFRDAIQISGRCSVHLNENYTDSHGQVHQQRGDIIFSGASVEEDLLNIKGCEGTAEEILKSRLSTVYGATKLFAGRLIIEDGAIYEGRGFTAMKDSSATVQVQNAQFNHAGDILFDSDSYLELVGASIVQGNTYINENSSLHIDVRNSANPSVLIGDLFLNGSLSVSAHENEINKAVLFVCGSINSDNQESFTINGKAYNISDCNWIDNTLVLNYREETFNSFYNGTHTVEESASAPAIHHHFETLKIKGKGLSSSDIGIYHCSSVIFTDCIEQPEWDNHTTLSHNKRIQIIDNTAKGAIESAYLTVSNNGHVEFKRNKAAEQADTFENYGGAIRYIWGGRGAILNENDTLIFDDNSAYVGGAIAGYHAGAINIEGNDEVVFRGNQATEKGGALYGGMAMALNIRNNGSVLFEKNVEKANEEYRLRSVFIQNRWASDVQLSAGENDSIIFKDSVFIGSIINENPETIKDFYLRLNESFKDSDGNLVEQRGDILFTGASTLSDLKAVKGTDGTASEILNSRTSEIQTRTNLYGGRLRVEDGAIYKGYGITAMEDSEATVRVKDAELSHYDYSMEFNAGTALEVAGTSTIRGNMKLMKGSIFKLESNASLCVHETMGYDVATLTIGGTILLEGNSTLNASLTLDNGSTLDMYILDGGAVALCGALTFGGQITMGDCLRTTLEEMREGSGSITLFTGLTHLVLPGTVREDATGRVWVGDVFSNMEGNRTHYLTYEANVGSLSVVYIPETTTTTLNLLALAGLTMRRRRK